MSGSESRLQDIIATCRGHLSEIQRLTDEVSCTLDSGSFDSVEGTFLRRGEEIALLTRSEEQLGKSLVDIPGSEAEPLLQEYIRVRNSLFKAILEQNKVLERSILSKRESVLSELKNLETGKKMHNRYIGGRPVSAGFVDIKE